MSGALQFVSRPIWCLKNYSTDTARDLTVLFRSKEKLAKENETLKNELAKTGFQSLQTDLLLMENIKLKEILGRSDENFKFLLATVIAKPSLSPYDSLIIDAGKNYGLKTGAKVLANGDVIIGEIVEVNANTAKVKLYSFPKDMIDVAVGFEKILTRAEGKGDGNFEIKFPQGIAVATGDIITLPELDRVVLGAVEEIIIDPENPFQIILFRSPINVFELRWVQILQE